MSQGSDGKCYNIRQGVRERIRFGKLDIGRYEQQMSGSRHGFFQTGLNTSVLKYRWAETGLHGEVTETANDWNDIDIIILYYLFIYIIIIFIMPEGSLGTCGEDGTEGKMGQICSTLINLWSPASMTPLLRELI